MSVDVIVCFENLQETISVCVRNPRLCKDDLWHSHVDYEICLQVSVTRKFYLDFFFGRSVSFPVPSLFNFGLLADQQHVLSKEDLLCKAALQ